MKNLTVSLCAASLLMVSGCSSITDKYEKPNCYKTVAIAKISLEEAHISAATLTTAGKISIEDSKKSYLVLDQSNEMVNTASALCSLDEVAARDYINQAYDMIENASNIMKGLD